MFSDIKTKLQKNKLLALAAAALFLGTIALSVAKDKTSSVATPSPFLSREELAKLTKPAVVRIAQKASGTYVIPEFKIDLENLKIDIKRDSLRNTQNLEEYITGSGFIISPDGYILTNAHVVSPEMIKVSLLSRALDENLKMTLQEVPADGQNKLFENPEQAEKFARDTLKLLMENSHFEITSKLAVLNPTSEKNNLTDLFDTGFKAEVLDLNENFLYGNKDVALIKVDQQRLPAIALGNPEQAVLGNPVFIFGFPGTAEVNSLNPVESTLTEGVISAFKYADNKDFKILETDAKVSQGSSGGPLLNEKGEVIGIITYQTNPLLRAIGDNFGFAIPVTLSRALKEMEKIPLRKGEFWDTAAQAFVYLNLGRCEMANKKFSDALAISNHFFLPSNYFSPYTQQCEQNILNGTSLDSWLDITLDKAKAFTPFEWFVILGRAILVASASCFLVIIFRKFRAEEKEIEKLEEELKETQEDILPAEIIMSHPIHQAPLPDEEIHAGTRHEMHIAHPHVIDYIKKARYIGLDDTTIAGELTKAGWDNREIEQAFGSI